MFPLTAADVVAASSTCDSCFDDGSCSELECENELGCSWCESENCDKTCPCVPVSQGCSGYSQGTYCQFDEQCGAGLQCSGKKGGFEWEQACCPEGKEWLPEFGTCGTEPDQKEYYTSEQGDLPSYNDSFDYGGDSDISLEYGSEGCTPGSCSSGDLDCDGFLDYICFASPEVCDGIDNDMDGVVDDGVCSENCGQCGAGALNGCDKEECEQLGNCEFTGTFMWWGTCAAGDFTEAVCSEDEVCDNTVDDDCNGKLDDGCDYEAHFEPLLPNVTDIGLKGYQEYYCIFDGQCNPPLKCDGAEFARAAAIQEGMQNIAMPPVFILRKLGIMPSTSKMAEEQNSAGGCCYEWEEWSHEDRECVDPRIGAHMKGCENDEECQPGLHCSWDAWTTTGACCPEGTEYDLEAGICIECGVPVMKNDTDYCSKKAEIGCACNAGEGNCASDTECFAGTYCSATETWLTKWWDLDICCPKGTTYDAAAGTCTPSNQTICSGSTKEKCFASGETCCFEDGICDTCIDLKRNERFCEDDSCCCDMDTGCDFSTNLTCSGGVCCYPWEWTSGNTGKCEIYCPDCDNDNDGYSNDFEQRVFSNPTWKDDTPWLRLSQENECGSMFEKFEIEEVDISANMKYVDAESIASLQSGLEGEEELNNTNAASGPNFLGFLMGLVPGALGGAWDDLQALGMLGYGIYKLGEIAAFSVADPYSAQAQAGYTWGQAQDIISVVWNDFGKVVHQAFVEGLEGASLQGEWASPWEDECTKVEYVRGYTTGYFVGYVIEQIAAAFFGISEIKAAIKAGWGATKIGQAIVKGLTLLEKFIDTILSPIRWVTRSIMDNVAVAVKKLMIRTFTSWSDEAVEGFARIVHHGGNRFARELMGEMGEAGLKRASKKFVKLANEFGDEAMSAMAKSKLGRLAVGQDWSLAAQKSLVRALQEGGEESLDWLAVGVSKTKIRQMGIRVGRLGAEVGSEAAESVLRGAAARSLLAGLGDETFEKFVRIVRGLPDTQVIRIADNIEDVIDVLGADNVDEFLELLEKSGVDSTEDILEKMGVEFIEEEEEEIAEIIALTGRQLDARLASLNTKLGNKLTSKHISHLKTTLARFDKEIAEEMITRMSKVDPQGIRDILDFFKGSDLYYGDALMVDLFSKHGDPAAAGIMNQFGDLYGPAFLSDNYQVRWGVIDNGYVFRGDSIAPDMAFQHGFKAKGTDYDYVHHTLQRADTGHISASTSITGSKPFGADQGGGYVYFIRERNGVMLRDVVPKDKIPDIKEYEVLFRDAISPVDIIGARKIDANGKFVGDFIPNPAARQALREAQQDSISLVGRGGGLIDDAPPVVGSGCFIAGTLVLTSEGRKPIEDIVAGDVVMSMDFESNSIVPAPVEETYSLYSDVKVEIKTSKGTIVTTPEHPFWVKDSGWTSASSLEEGIELSSAEGEAIEISYVSEEPELFPVFNIKVGEQHNYFVSEESILVHNKPFYLGDDAGRVINNLGREWTTTAKDIPVASFDEAIEGVWQKADNLGIPKDSFKKSLTITDLNGNKHVVEWAAELPGGGSAEITIDFGHLDNGPNVNHVGLRVKPNPDNELPGMLSAAGTHHFYPENMKWPETVDYARIPGMTRDLDLINEKDMNEFLRLLDDAGYTYYGNTLKDIGSNPYNLLS